jgi:AcrR family transcriptional regulator
MRIHQATRQLLPRAERQAQLLRAAAAAFARAGFAGTSMDDVAAAAGVSRLIVYRHFDSKEALYRAVLDGVGARLRDEFLAGLDAPGRAGFVVRGLLAVAREDPDGFRLLWVHAAREPQFTEYATEFREGAALAADLLIGASIADRTFRRWATHAVVGALADSVLAWLDEGDLERDEMFVATATAGLRAMCEAWIAASPR